MSSHHGCLSAFGLLLTCLLAVGSAQLIPTITPSFTLKFQNESVQLSCLLGGVVADKVVWRKETKDNESVEIGSDWPQEYNKTVFTAYLTIPKRKDSAELPFAGKYSCRFFSSSDVPISGEAQTIVRASPSPGKGKYLSHEGFKYVMQSYDKKEGETVEIKCSVEGYPKPKFDWRIDRDLLKKIDRPDYIDRVSMVGDTLSINNLRYEDRAEYVCIADNGPDGEIHLITLVRVKSKLAPLWPALGIFLEALVIIVIILICEKRRKRKEAQEEEENAKKQ